MRILYLVSLFPCWSETFIVREIEGVMREGAEVRILSLKPPSETLVQKDAALLLDRVIYPASWWNSLTSVLVHCARHPLREAHILVALAASLCRHPAALAKSVVVWWRTLGMLGDVRRFDPDHIHAHWATYPATSALILSRRLGKPFSFTAHAHDLFVEDHLLAEKVRAAKLVVTISEFNRRYLCAHIDGASERRIEVIHCGVSPSAFPYSSAGRDRARILSVGRLDEIKGFAHLVEACHILRKRGVPFRCQIIGSGPLEESLRCQVESLGLNGAIEFAGARPQSEVIGFLEQAGVFVLASVVTASGDRDGIPVALMEAMACGMPVISTRVSGIPELVEDGVTGLLASPGNAAELADCLARLMADPALSERLAGAARQRIEADFNIGTEASRLFHAIAGVPGHAL